MMLSVSAIREKIINYDYVFLPNIATDTKTTIDIV